MRIAMVVPSAGFVGGIERHAFDLSIGLARRGHRLTLVHGDLSGRDTERYAAPFERVVPRRDVTNLDLSDGLLDDLDVVYVHRASSVWELTDFRALPMVVVSHDHDLTCVRSHRYLPIGREPCHRPPGIACVRHGCVVVRDRNPDSRLPIAVRDPFRLRRRLHALARRAPLVGCSGYVRDQLVRAGVPAHRAHVVHPIPPETPAPLTPRPSDPELLVVGALITGKGVDLAIDALGMHDALSRATLTIVGDGAQRRGLEERARGHGNDLGSRVRFTGWVPPSEVVGHVDRASVVLVPSRWPEPFGMVGIEAMRRARPVVAAGHGGIPEWASGTRGARTFTPGDARALAEATAELLADADAGDAALEHAQRRFPHARLLDEVEALLERVIAEDA